VKAIPAKPDEHVELRIPDVHERVEGRQEHADYQQVRGERPAQDWGENHQRLGHVVRQVEDEQQQLDEREEGQENGHEQSDRAHSVVVEETLALFFVQHLFNLALAVFLPELGPVALVHVPVVDFIAVFGRHFFRLGLRGRLFLGSGFLFRYGLLLAEAEALFLRSILGRFLRFWLGRGRLFLGRVLRRRFLDRLHRFRLLLFPQAEALLLGGFFDGFVGS
jgi:hypothetical protein